MWTCMGCLPSRVAHPPNSRFYPYMASNMLGFNSRCSHAHKCTLCSELSDREDSQRDIRSRMGFSLHEDGLSIWPIHAPSHPKKEILNHWEISSGCSQNPWGHSGAWEVGCDVIYDETNL